METVKLKKVGTLPLCLPCCPYYCSTTFPLDKPIPLSILGEYSNQINPFGYVGGMDKKGKNIKFYYIGEFTGNVGIIEPGVKAIKFFATIDGKITNEVTGVVLTSYIRNYYWDENENKGYVAPLFKYESNQWPEYNIIKNESIIVNKTAVDLTKVPSSQLPWYEIRFTPRTKSNENTHTYIVNIDLDDEAGAAYDNNRSNINANIDYSDTLVNISYPASYCRKMEPVWKKIPESVFGWNIKSPGDYNLIPGISLLPNSYDLEVGDFGNQFIGDNEFALTDRYQVFNSSNSNFVEISLKNDQKINRLKFAPIEYSKIESQGLLNETKKYQNEYQETNKVYKVSLGPQYYTNDSNSNLPGNTTQSFRLEFSYPKESWNSWQVKINNEESASINNLTYDGKYYSHNVGDFVFKNFAYNRAYQSIRQSVPEAESNTINLINNNIISEFYYWTIICYTTAADVTNGGLKGFLLKNNTYSLKEDSVSNTFYNWFKITDIITIPQEIKSYRIYIAKKPLEQILQDKIEDITIYTSGNTVTSIKQSFMGFNQLGFPSAILTGKHQSALNVSASSSQYLFKAIRLRQINESSDFGYILENFVTKSSDQPDGNKTIGIGDLFKLTKFINQSEIAISPSYQGSKYFPQENNNEELNKYTYMIQKVFETNNIVAFSCYDNTLTDENKLNDGDKKTIIGLINIKNISIQNNTLKAKPGGFQLSTQEDYKIFFCDLLKIKCANYAKVFYDDSSIFNNSKDNFYFSFSPKVLSNIKETRQWERTCQAFWNIFYSLLFFFGYDVYSDTLTQSDANENLFVNPNFVDIVSAEVEQLSDVILSVLSKMQNFVINNKRYSFHQNFYQLRISKNKIELGYLEPKDNPNKVETTSDTGLEKNNQSTSSSNTNQASSQN